MVLSPGISIGLNRSTNTVTVTLQILSTEQAELVHMRVELRNNNGTHSMTCENSEPVTIYKVVATAKMIEQKIHNQELEGFVRGAIYPLNGYAKFRDGDKQLTQAQISLVTIPSC
jgi:hypothetical protein